MFQILHPNRWFFYFLAIAASVLLVVYWSAQLFVIEQDTAVNQDAATTQVIDKTKNTSTTTADNNFDISKWQTYRNEKYGFEVKYSPELKVQPTFKTQDVYKSSLILFNGRAVADASVAINIFENGNPNLVSINKLVGGEFMPKTKGTTYQLYGKVGGVDAVISDRGKIVWFTRGHELFTIVNGAVFSPQVNEDVFKNILSTFKFFEPTTQ